MAQYRKKSVIIEAERFTGIFQCSDTKGVCTKPECLMDGPHLHTIHKDQKVVLEIGDWITGTRWDSFLSLQT